MAFTAIMAVPSLLYPASSPSQQLSLRLSHSSHRDSQLESPGQRLMYPSSSLASHGSSTRFNLPVKPDSEPQAEFTGKLRREPGRSLELQRDHCRVLVH